MSKRRAARKRANFSSGDVTPPVRADQVLRQPRGRCPLRSCPTPISCRLRQPGHDSPGLMKASELQPCEGFAMKLSPILIAAAVAFGGNVLAQSRDPDTK